MELPPGRRRVTGRVVRAKLEQGTPEALGCLGEWCVLCWSSRKRSEKKELHCKSTHSPCNSTETLPGWSPSVTHRVPATLPHAGTVPLALSLLQVGSFGPGLSWTSGALLLVAALVLRLPLSDPVGRTQPAPPSACHRSAELPSSALTTFFSCSIFHHDTWRHLGLSCVRRDPRVTPSSKTGHQVEIKKIVP